MKKLIVGTALALSLFGCKSGGDEAKTDDVKTEKAACAKCDGTDAKAACACPKKTEKAKCAKCDGSDAKAACACEKK